MISKTKMKQRARKKENIEIKKLVDALKKQNDFWMKIAYLLTRPARNKIEASLGRLNEETKENDVVIVPGKVLSQGEMGHKITIAALSFSEKALQKLKNCKILTIEEMMKSSKDGRGVKVIV